MLVELMVIIVVVVILVVIVFLSFQSMICLSWVSLINNEVLGLFSFVCSEVICSNRGGGVCGSSDGVSCDGVWLGGMLVFVDVNGDGVLLVGEIVLCFVSGNFKLKIIGLVMEIVFDGCGCCCVSVEQDVWLELDVCSKGVLYKCILMVNVFGQICSIKEVCL